MDCNREIGKKIYFADGFKELILEGSYTSRTDIVESGDALKVSKKR